jgi:hypothetical protein
MRTEILRQTSLLGSFPSSDLVLLAELALYGDFELLPEILFLRRSHPRQSTKGSLGPERARAVWMDTSLSGRILFPKWLALVAFLRAVQRAPLSTKARIYCYMQVLHWSVIWRNLRGLIKDLLWAAWKLLLQSRPVSAHKVLSQSVDR